MFQNFQGNNAITSGTHLSVTAHAMSHEDDFIGDVDCDIAIYAKYFDDEMTMVSIDSTHIKGSSLTENEWHHFGVEGTVPEGATIVQAGVMYIQNSVNTGPV